MDFKVGDWVRIIKDHQNGELLYRCGKITSDGVKGYLCVQFEGWGKGHDGTPSSNGIGPHWWFPPECLVHDETFIAKKILESYSTNL
jgi:hypothetical protein